MRTTRFAAALVCALSISLSACAAGGKATRARSPEVAQTGTIDKSLFSKDPRGILSEDRIQAILDRPLEIELPARVGILPINAAADWHGPGPAHDRASPAVAKLAELLRGGEPFTMVTEMISIPSGSLGMEALREIAARYKLRYVVLYREHVTRKRKTNAWSLGYVTLVGALFLPGDSLEIDGYIEASMFDVKTGLLMFTTRKRVRDRRSENPWHTADKLDDLQTRVALRAADDLAKQLRSAIAGFERAVAAEQKARRERRPEKSPPAANPEAASLPDAGEKVVH